VKIQKTNFFISFLILLFFVVAVGVSPVAYALEYPQEEQNATDITNTTTTSTGEINLEEKPAQKYIRGIHFTAHWIGSSKENRKIAMDLFENTELNTAVIDIKECEGRVYIDGVNIVNANRAYTMVIPDIKNYISCLKDKGIYTIARIAVFRDNTMARKNPNLAVKNPDGTIWTDKQHIAWLDPYNEDAWDYNLQIAQRAAAIGFDEIQFDYIRFPSDGNINKCRYSKPYCALEASGALVGFLKEASRRLKAKGVKISIDVFGLTTTVTDDMGIGQKIVEMTEWADYVSPMAYPSHYAKWTYGVAEPNKEPYKIVYCAMKDALKRVPSQKLRPWLQDFSSGHKYDKNAVRAQIQACYDNNIGSWMLWNSRCVYTRKALKGKDEGNSYQESDPPTDEMLKTANKKRHPTQAIEKTIEKK
jgi:hypothetical protein